ncbi:MAG: T9SS type A sorting domain-containing protein [Ignavibacteriales bacterium]|nr:T9SS type A sorting domain-containing protein [Ignavibacteriales bacterium]
MKTFGIFFAALAISTTLLAQDYDDVKLTEWVSSEGERPETRAEWKARFDAKPKETGAGLVYETPRGFSFAAPSAIDTFVFGEDYAAPLVYVYRPDGSMSDALPPDASFYVYMNGDTTRLLTDESPRWSLNEANITGKGYLRSELGNFSDPPFEAGDEATIVYTERAGDGFRQGATSFTVATIPPSPMPRSLFLEQTAAPEPPRDVRVERDGDTARVSWRGASGLEYDVFRRSLGDLLTTNFPRYEYELIASGVSTETYADIETSGDRFGYIVFARDPATGLRSGRSREGDEGSVHPDTRLVLVEPSLYAAIQTNLLDLVSEWETECDRVIVYSRSFADIHELKDTLRAIPGLTGALLVGEHPVPYYQQGVCEDGSCEGFQEYPCDLFYMDLDGEWSDRYTMSYSSYEETPDGVFDTHTQNYPINDEAPEIVLGRLLPTESMGDAAELVNAYLERVVNYRRGLGGVRRPMSALSFCDDDWRDWGNDVASTFIPEAFPDVKNVYRVNETTAANYKAELPRGYHMIHTYVHSSSLGHSFAQDDGSSSRWVSYSDIVDFGADANFYLLFACGNSRYTRDNNCGATYALRTESCVNTVGTTHSGGMRNYKTFYGELARGASYGEAYLRTYQAGAKSGFTQDSKNWMYGLTLNGDPFTTLAGPETPSFVGSSDAETPERFAVGCYPNPFNATTTVRITPGAAASVEFRVYDALGAEVASPVRKRIDESGGEFAFDGSALASGVYFYRARAEFSDGGVARAAGKLVLLK